MRNACTRMHSIPTNNIVLLADNIKALSVSLINMQTLVIAY